MNAEGRRQLQRDLFSEIGGRIAEYGFHPSEQEQLFFKWKTNTRLVLHLGFVNHKLDFDLTLDVACRFSDLEGLLNACESDSLASIKIKAYSLGAEVGNIQDGKQKRWTFANRMDINNNIGDLMETIYSVALPYLDKYSDPDEAFKILNDDSKGWIHSPINLVRCKRALGLTLLMHDFGLYSQVADEKMRFLRGLDSALELSQFQTFKQCLDEMWARGAGSAL